MKKILTLGMFAVLAVSVFAQTNSKLTQDMGIDQKLGARIPLDAEFKDETGKPVKLVDMFQGRPILLVPIFYSCKTMCVNLTNSVVETLSGGTAYDKLKPGRDLDVVMLSIKPTETPELAAAKKVEIFNMLTPPKDKSEDEQWREDASKGFHLLTGSYENIRKVTDAIGFRYHWDPAKDLINHPTCSIVLSKTGQVTGYMIGPDIPTRVLEADLDLANSNKVAQKADQSFMFGCIMLDPSTGKYTFVVEKIVNLGCVLTVLILVSSIVGMSLKERRKVRTMRNNLGNP